MLESKETLSRKIKKKARELGLLDCGIAPARRLDAHEAPLKEWLREQRYGEMDYMGRNTEKRLDPRKLVPGAQSLIVVLQNYFTNQEQPPDAPRISKYAYGKDYHTVLKQKLWKLADYIKTYIPGLYGRAFTDTAPVLERAWMMEAGLGWIGKNTNAISIRHGSYFFIGELIIDAELAYDTPKYQDYCGTCTRCMDACPTGAIIEPRKLDANRCISYWTIEYKGAFPADTPSDFAGYIFGCDICQEVCPWNTKARPHNEPAFNPHPQLLTMKANQWEALTEAQFKTLFRKSAVKRTKYKGLVRNMRHIYRKNSNHE